MKFGIGSSTLKVAGCIAFWYMPVNYITPTLHEAKIGLHKISQKQLTIQKTDA
jgi:hypothetical protein